MRGRTLDHAFVILDEAQNATLPQLKMFLTRMGRNAKFVITGDVTQVDLPDATAQGCCPPCTCCARWKASPSSTWMRRT
jgi:phosphate starvation-inducible PhoH-like protein